MSSHTNWYTMYVCISRRFCVCWLFQAAFRRPIGVLDFMLIHRLLLYRRPGTAALVRSPLLLLVGGDAAVESMSLACGAASSAGGSGSIVESTVVDCITTQRRTMQNRVLDNRDLFCHIVSTFIPERMRRSSRL